MAVVELVPNVIGSQTPRIRVIPGGKEHPKWTEVVEFVNALGVDLDPWQWDVLHAALLRDADVWAAFTVAVCCPRQNGKNGILEIRELIGPIILGEKLLIHTAHLADTSKEGFRRLDDLIDANEWLSKQVRHIWRTNGHESIEFMDGRRIRFRTRTRGGGRGFSGSPVFFDESMFLPEVSMASIMPVVSAQPDPQLWYMGSAVDQLSMDDGVVFARVRERALNGDSDRLAYFEWSLDYPNPDAVPADLDVQAAAAETNPAYGIRISRDYIAAEQDNLDVRSSAVERFGVGDWPRTDGMGHMIINPKVWAELTDETSKRVGAIVFTFDISPDRSRSAIAATGRRSDGLLHTEIIEHKSGTGWVAARLVELASRHKPSRVVCDGVGPAASLVAEVEALDVKVETLEAREYAHACGLFFDAVEQGQLRHLGTPELASALRGAGTRPLSDAWAWSRKNSSTDIAPLVACTIGVWGVLTGAEVVPLFAFG
jgi:hypothetical protein